MLGFASVFQLPSANLTFCDWFLIQPLPLRSSSAFATHRRTFCCQTSVDVQLLSTPYVCLILCRSGFHVLLSVHVHHTGRIGYLYLVGTEHWQMFQFQERQEAAKPLSSVERLYSIPCGGTEPSVDDPSYVVKQLYLPLLSTGRQEKTTMLESGGSYQWQKIKAKRKTLAIPFIHHHIFHIRAKTRWLPCRVSDNAIPRM